ncbi:MAG: GxxExxY protein [Planctomycetes bacterium]|nr:GxxExxY protein [Planctomycetota bacterium]
MEFGELTEKIIGAAIEVHKTLGPGFVESIYEESLVIEFGERSISFQRQLVVPVFYRSRQVGQHRLDLLVEGEIVVELKAVRSFQPLHLAVTRSYLRATGRKHGLLLNFAAAVLQVKRVLAS